MSKYGVFSGPYFPAFGLNTERYFVYFQKYLDFPWKINNMVKLLVLTVPPFVFTKVVRPLVKYWRFNSIKILIEITLLKIFWKNPLSSQIH